MWNNYSANYAIQFIQFHRPFNPFRYRHLMTHREFRVDLKYPLRTKKNPEPFLCNFLFVSSHKRLGSLSKWSNWVWTKGKSIVYILYRFQFSCTESNRIQNRMNKLHKLAWTISVEIVFFSRLSDSISAAYPYPPTFCIYNNGSSSMFCKLTTQFVNRR